MKKIATILLASLLVYWVGKPIFIKTDRPPATVVNEAVFIDIMRDLELLNSWLSNRYDPQETIERLRHQNHQKILTLYGVDPAAFQASVQYYLEDARALKVYEKVYLALEALST